MKDYKQILKIFYVEEQEPAKFARDLETRTKKFAISIITLSSKLPDTVEVKVIRNQITKSGTSIGANYREANRARSKADFKSKIKICESESSETLFWLEIIHEMDLYYKDELEPVLIECDELLALFTAIGKKLK